MKTVGMFLVSMVPIMVAYYFTKWLAGENGWDHQLLWFSFIAGYFFSSISTFWDILIGWRD